jgi:hypothetical protein
MNIEAAVPSALAVHPAVRDVRLIGSRAEARAHDLSDWDFAVDTDDFESVSSDLPKLVAPLRPVAEQWDPYSAHACYMLMLPGPTKVDLLFLDERREWSPAWEPSPATLAAIDQHFWDWILWLEQKRRGGREDVLRAGLDDMYRLLLGPIGVRSRPRSVGAALAGYLDARARLEREYGVSVPRRLEHVVLPAIATENGAG